MIVLDANILVSAVLGRQAPVLVERLLTAGVELATPTTQIAEAHVVITEKLGLGAHTVAALADLCEGLRRLDSPEYAAAEHSARQRLHRRAQSDWPVLAAAIALGGTIWSNDRDFFGVGVRVWSTRNIHLSTA